MNYDGLKTAIIEMLSGSSVKVNTATFKNDTVNIQSKPEYKSAYPALVVELKWNQKVQTAIQQIKDRKYPSSISDYTGDILLVRINYDKKSKKHQCIIEKV